MATFQERIYKLYDEARSHNHRLGEKTLPNCSVSASPGQWLTQWRWPARLCSLKTYNKKGQGICELVH